LGQAKISKALLNKMPCSLRTLVCDQLTNLDFKVITELANQTRIQSLKIIFAVPVEVRSWNIQLLANLIFRDPSLFQNALYIEL
jgi:hypothetical protein